MVFVWETCISGQTIVRQWSVGGLLVGGWWPIPGMAYEKNLHLWYAVCLNSKSPMVSPLSPLAENEQN